MSKISEHRNVIAIPSEAVLRDRLVKIQFDSMRQLLLSSLVLDKKSSLWPMPAFSTPRSAFTSESKSSLTGLGVLVSLSPQRARKPKSPFGCPKRSNWEIREFPKTLSREFSKFPRTKTLVFSGFLVIAPVDFLFSQGCFGNFRQS
jgi:hypothetical protein